MTMMTRSRARGRGWGLWGEGEGEEGGGTSSCGDSVRVWLWRVSADVPSIFHQPAILWRAAAHKDAEQEEGRGRGGGPASV